MPFVELALSQPVASAVGLTRWPSDPAAQQPVELPSFAAVAVAAVEAVPQQPVVMKVAVLVAWPPSSVADTYTFVVAVAMQPAAFAAACLDAASCP